MRLYFTALVTLAALAHVAWEYFNGGVVSHHLLQRADMPAISNWWGLLVLPAMTWFLAGRIQKNAHPAGPSGGTSLLPGSVVTGFAGSLAFGVLLSAAFVTGAEAAASWLFLSLFLLGLLLPVYRAQCVLGFVIGMTFTFGVVLATAVGCIVAAVSAMTHLFLRPALVRLWLRLTPHLRGM